MYIYMYGNISIYMLALAGDARVMAVAAPSWVEGLWSRRETSFPERFDSRVFSYQTPQSRRCASRGRRAANQSSSSHPKPELL